MNWDRTNSVLATGLGLGKSPYMPGTVGTLLGIPLVWMLYKLGPHAYLIITFLLTVLSVFICEVYERNSRSHDSKEIVIDEIVGYMITMAWLPQTWQAYLAAFLVFRILDILKPFPIGYLDKKVKGGLGVVADDVAAGVIGNVLLQMAYLNTDFLGVQLSL